MGQKPNLTLILSGRWEIALKYKKKLILKKINKLKYEKKLILMKFHKKNFLKNSQNFLFFQFFIRKYNNHFLTSKSSPYLSYPSLIIVFVCQTKIFEQPSPSATTFFLTSLFWDCHVPDKGTNFPPATVEANWVSKGRIVNQIAMCFTSQSLDSRRGRGDVQKYIAKRL